MRVLVIAHNSFSDVLNNGKTLESLFRNFEKEDLAQLFFSENESPDFKFCQNYFKVTDIDVLQNLLKRSRQCGKKIMKLEENHILSDDKGRFLTKSFDIVKKYADKMTIFRDYLWSFNSWKSQSLYKWVESFRPEVIFYVGGNSGFSHEIATFLSEKYNIPLSIFFTDDYLIHPKNRNILDFFQRNRMKKFYSRTVNKSSLCYAIGEAMADEYSRYFNKKFLVIMNSVVANDYILYEDRNKKIIFSYFGGLHLKRWKMLIKFAECINSGQLDVYSVITPKNNILEKFKRVGINFKGSVSGVDLQEAILFSDILLHVESDDDYNRQLTKLSISTKIPEYLMSGRAIIGFGPDDVASMKILSDNEIGLVLSSELPKENLKKELKIITETFIFRQKLGRKGYDFAVNNFNNQSVAAQFKERLYAIVPQKKS